MSMQNKSMLDMIIYLLVIIGGLNWGLVGAFDFDLVMAIAGMFGEMQMMIAKIIYSVVGISSVIALFKFFACCSSQDCN